MCFHVCVYMLGYLYFCCVVCCFFIYIYIIVCFMLCMFVCIYVYVGICLVAGDENKTFVDILAFRLVLYVRFHVDHCIFVFE